MAHEDMTQQVELKMSTPFSDLQTWTRKIQGAFKVGPVFFKGASGSVGEAGYRIRLHHGTRDSFTAFDPS
jgi:hypothetical protein